jgi:Putative zinc-finger
MERAPLRPMPSRPAGPVSMAEAAAAVASALPSVDAREAQALALVGVAGMSRGEAAEVLSLGTSELGVVLAAARKTLRASVRPLAGSGWCERAERLVSDRLDLELLERDAALLDVHLRNCPRCVEHERRLVHATDALIARVPGVLPQPADEPVSTPALSLVEDVPEEEAAPAAVDAPARTRRGLALAAIWNVLLVVAVILTLAARALSLAGILGADL